MGGAWRARRARTSWAGALLSLTVLWGCAASNPLTAADGGYRNARHGYRLGVPPAGEPPWEPQKVEGSLLAFHRTGVAWMTFSSRCGEPITRPELLARHLRIGIPANVVRESGPVELGALSGWQQVFDADAAHGAVRVKTVTFAANGCAFDWVLVARESGGFENAEPDFDAWWATLAVEPQTGTATASDAKPQETP
jgi:hypothetical protein